MNDSAPVLIRVARRFNTPPERVFDAFLDVKLARRFMFATETGEMVRAEIDSRVGGRFVFTDRRDGEDVEHTGIYLEIERPRRLVFAFGVEKYSKEMDRVTIDIVPEDGGSLLTLTHEMKPEYAEYRERTQEGWGKILEGLAGELR